MKKKQAKEISAEQFRDKYTRKGSSNKFETIKEEHEQLWFCQHVTETYPNAVYMSDLAGVGLSLKDRKAYQMRSRTTGQTDKIPDFMLFVPQGKFTGLALELKSRNVNLYKKNGDFRKNEHVAGQRKILKRFSGYGWLAGFACGLDDMKAVVDHYMQQEFEAAKLILKSDKL